jgi:GAF domain-containing protein
MIEFLRYQLLDLRHPYRDPLDRERALILLRFNLVLAAFWFLGSFINTIGIFITSGAVTPISIIYLFAILPIAATHLLVQNGRLNIAAYLLVAFVTFTLVPILNDVTTGYLLVFLVLPLIVGILLLPRGQQFWMIALVAAVVVARGLLQGESVRTVRFTPADTAFRDLWIAFVGVIVTSAFLLIANRSNRRLSSQMQRSSRVLRSVGAYRSLVAGIYDEERIMVRALETLQIDLDYALATAFRLNESGGFTRLRLGGVAQDISRADIRLREDATAVGEAARQMQPVIANSFDSGALGAHILVPARWCAALPVIRDGTLLGVIDIQTTLPDGFAEDEIEAFGVMVDQIAAALFEARDFRELQRINREQEELLQRYQGQLAQVEQRGQQLFVSAWDRYVQVRSEASGGFGFDLLRSATSDTAITPASDLPPSIREALNAGDIHIERTPSAQIVRVPVVFRGQTLGAMTFGVPNDRPLNDRQLDLLRTVTTRLGVALENNRLFEQSQAQAIRERKVSDIAGRLITATDIDALMTLAASSFNEALGAVGTRVVLEPSRLADLSATNPPTAPPSHSNGHHSNGNGSSV